MLHPSRPLRRLAPAVVLAGTVIALAGGGSSAVAHGTCTPQADPPVRPSYSITGTGRYSCTSAHRTISINVCLQHYNGSSWSTVSCNSASRSFAGSVSATVSAPCSGGLWRTRATGTAEGDGSHGSTAFSTTSRFYC